MKFAAAVFLALTSAFAFAQQPAIQPADALAKLSFMQGIWLGKQDFNNDGGPKMVGDATDRIEQGIEGKYICEMLSTTLPGASPPTHVTSSPLTSRAANTRHGGSMTPRTTPRS
jgi:hypothetical protein